MGLRAFHNVMNYEPFQNLPIVLETPIEVKGPDGKMVEDKKIWADEIKLLESLIDMDVESEEFKQEEAKLHEKGAAERARIQDQVDKKVEKDAKKAEREAGKAKKKAAGGGTATKKSVKRKKKEEESCDSCGESE